MKIKTDIIVVGSGAGGATVARELAGAGKNVLLIERGGLPLGIGKLRTAVLEMYDRCALRTSDEGMIIYRALMVGGTTVVSCGNGIRVLEEELNSRGIDLSEYFEEAEKELNIAPIAEDLIGPGSHLIMDAANRLGMNMTPMPKFIDPARCNSCGKCVLGCPRGAKWTALKFVEDARRNGTVLLDNTDVRSVAIHRNRAVGIVAEKDNRKIRIYANKVILCAGGIGTPVILRRSGLKEAGHKLFGDVFNVTYGIFKSKDVNLSEEPTMAVVSKKFYRSDGFILSPYVDVPLVLRWVMSKRKQLKGFRHEELLGIMAKTRDDRSGSVSEKERFQKKLTTEDRLRLSKGSQESARILMEAGVRKKDVIFTSPRAAHPGGSAAIGEVVDSDLKTKVRDLYVCDASALPASPGAPPILTIVALAKRLSRHLLAVGSDD